MERHQHGFVGFRAGDFVQLFRAETFALELDFKSLDPSASAHFRTASKRVTCRGSPQLETTVACFSRSIVVSLACKSLCPVYRRFATPPWGRASRTAYAPSYGYIICVPPSDTASALERAFTVSIGCTVKAFMWPLAAVGGASLIDGGCQRMPRSSSSRTSSPPLLKPMPGASDPAPDQAAPRLITRSGIGRIRAAVDGLRPRSDRCSSSTI